MIPFPPPWAWDYLVEDYQAQNDPTILILIP